MSQALLSKPLFSLLLITGVVSVVMMLEPRVDAESSADDLLSDHSQQSLSNQPSNSSINNSTIKADNTSQQDLAKTGQHPSPALAPWQRQLFQFKAVKTVNVAQVTLPPPVMTPPVSQTFSHPVLSTANSGESNTVSVYTPTMPFAYLGRLVRDDTTTLFFDYQEQHLAVKEGEIFEKNWQLERVTDNTAFIRYLPNNSLQSLSLSDSE